MRHLRSVSVRAFLFQAAVMTLTVLVIAWVQIRAVRAWAYQVSWMPAPTR